MSEERFAPIVNFVSPLPSKELVVISRVFTHFLGVANAVKAHQHCCWLKMDLTTEGLLGALDETKHDSTAGVLEHFFKWTGYGGNGRQEKGVKRQTLPKSHQSNR